MDTRRTTRSSRLYDVAPEISSDDEAQGSCVGISMPPRKLRRLRRRETNDDSDRFSLHSGLGSRRRCNGSNTDRNENFNDQGFEDSDNGSQFRRLTRSQRKSEKTSKYPSTSLADAYAPKDKSNGASVSTTSARRYSVRKRKKTEVISISSFSSQKYGEVSNAGEEGGDEKENDDKDDVEKSSTESSESDEEDDDDSAGRRYPIRRNRFKGSANVNKLFNDSPDRSRSRDSSRDSNGRKYSLRQNRAKRVPFNVAPPQPAKTTRSSSKSRLSRWMEREERNAREERRERKRARRVHSTRWGRRRRYGGGGRRHYDSSSDSSSNDENESPSYGRLDTVRSLQGGDEAEFRDYQRRREAQDLDRIRPINGSSAAKASRPSSRDLARADAEPVDIDPTVDWSHVGGLEHHIKTLKEMVVLPLLYPEIFERFKMQPPRGVIFHGPPGTGKTLVARALANSCTVGSKRVAFFMRKGADVVSKWVGEAEKQLRLLFEQAKRHQPSIIFFDEIDGLAPVRSSKQDQVHASIVATLLALMDGLDARGNVVVIAATNRIDAIDPALRRPGRFDRELRFALPNRIAREKIFRIHTRAWNPAPSDAFCNAVARSTVGFCGADMKQLCVEAALAALHRCYPQVYTSEHKLVLDPKEVTPVYRDFVEAMKRIVPAARRMETEVGTQPRPLDAMSKILLQDAGGEKAFSLVSELFEVMTRGRRDKDSSNSKDDENSSTEWYEVPPTSEVEAVYGTNGDGSCDRIEIEDLSHAARAVERACPSQRLLICGDRGSGQKELLAALLHQFVGAAELPVFSITLPALLSNPSATVEEFCMSRLRAARRSAPCVVVFPRIELLWDAASRTLRVAIEQWSDSLPARCSSPVLVLATSNERLENLEPSLRSNIFRAGTNASDASSMDTVVQLASAPSLNARRSLFRKIFRDECLRSLRVTHVASGNTRKRRPTLERAPETPGKSKSRSQSDSPRVLHERDEHHLRELRVFMRECLNELSKNQRYRSFIKMVDSEEVPDYYTIISNPMCFDRMFEKVDARQYVTLGAFMRDLKLIGDNVRAYNPCDRNDATGRRLLRNAVSMIDAAESMAFRFKSHIRYDLFKICDGIAARGRAFPGRRLIPSLYTTPDPVDAKTAERPEWVHVEDRCSACLSGDRQEEILLCDTPGCSREYHMFCLEPPLTEVPEGKWFCPHCRSDAFGSNRDGAEFVGVSIARFFNGDKLTRGVVTEYYPPDEGTIDPPLWHVRHTDGDEEDLERHELETAMLAQGKFVGMRVKRVFEGVSVVGIVTKYRPPARGSGDPGLWHVRHVDDDEEDLERHEVEEAIRKYRLERDEPSGDAVNGAPKSPVAPATPPPPPLRTESSPQEEEDESHAKRLDRRRRQDLESSPQSSDGTAKAPMHSANATKSSDRDRMDVESCLASESACKIIEDLSRRTERCNFRDTVYRSTKISTCLRELLAEIAVSTKDDLEGFIEGLQNRYEERGLFRP